MSRTLRLGASSIRPSSRWAVVALAFILLLSLSLRVYISRHCSFWLDEVWTRHDAAVPWPDLLRGASREHPPLMYWFVRGSMALFGTGELAIRAPSLLFGCVLLGAVYLLCLELELRPTQALVVVASLALTPFFLRHATEARHYSMLPAFTTFATLFTLRLLRAPGDFPALLGFALSAAAAAATQYFGLAYAAALGGALLVSRLWARRRGESRPRPDARSLVVLGLSGLVLVIVTVRAIWLARFYADHRVGPPARDLFGSMLSEFAFFQGRPFAAMLEPFVAAAGLVALGLRRRGMARFVPFGLTFPPCAGALLISSGHAVGPRYLAPSFVLYHLGASAAVLLVCDVIGGKVASATAVNAKETRATAVSAKETRATAVSAKETRATAVNALRWAAAAVPVLGLIALRVAEYPAGYGTGVAYYAGLQAYFRDGRAKDAALVVFPHFPGEFIMRTQYGIDQPLVSLEDFKPIEGVKRYVIAGFERPSQIRQFERALGQALHLSPRQWRELPLAPLAHTRFQPAVRARIFTPR